MTEDDTAGTTNEDTANITDESTTAETADLDIDPSTQRTAVRERYGAIATSSGDEDSSTAVESCCGTGPTSTTTDSCCEPSTADGTTTESTDGTTTESTDGKTTGTTTDSATEVDLEEAKRVGYSAEDLEVAPEANLGLGCGNPTAIASLDPGETVLDLGSGGGFDCFLAAQEVGESGQVIGVDMTPEMIERARSNVADDVADRVEFRLGEIEHLPVADETVDVIISNCVINLSPHKQQVFDEAIRVLRPGGRLAVSDVVETAPLPDDVRRDPASLSACVSGAATISALEEMLDAAGFVDVEITPKDESEEFIREWDDDRDLSEYILSASIEARKPAAGRGGSD